MEEEIKNNPAEEKPIPQFKSGGQNITITPVTSPSSKPATPLPRVAQPLPPFPPIPEPVSRQKRDTMTLLLILAALFNILSLWIFISIGMDKIPGFLSRFF